MAAKKRKKRKATPAQLKALAKGRAARKKKLARKKPAKKRAAPKRRKSPAKKRAAPKRRKKTARKKRAKRNPTSLEYFIYTYKGKGGTKYYLQKKGGKWVLDSDKPAGMGPTAKNKAIAFAKRLIKRLPAGYNIHMDVKKKSR